MEDVKIYGLCLERLRHQIANAKKKVNSDESLVQERFLLESYNTAEIDDIIDILELYDVVDKTARHVKEKLEELAYTVSLLLRETIAFDLTDNAHLGLYLLVHNESPRIREQETVTAR